VERPTALGPDGAGNDPASAHLEESIRRQARSVRTSLPKWRRPSAQTNSQAEDAITLPVCVTRATQPAEDLRASGTWGWTADVQRRTKLFASGQGSLQCDSGSKVPSPARYTAYQPVSRRDANSASPDGPYEGSRSLKMIHPSDLEGIKDAYAADKQIEFPSARWRLVV
jgi:hypothetical protein